MLSKEKAKVCVASDHAGFFLKQKLIQKYDLIDFGSYDAEPCDYPVFAKKLVNYVLQYKYYGVLICGTGVGMSIAANRYRGIRAALCYNSMVSEMSRKHNDANIMILGARLISTEEACKCFEKFISTAFEGGRHKRRIDMIDV